MTVTLLRDGRLIDPSTGRDEQGDLLLRDGVIAAVDHDGAEADRIVDAAGMIVSPGLIETQATLREPAWEDEDTIAAGTMAALAGGVTSLVCLPQDQPVVDNRAAVEFIRRQAERAGNCHVFVVGAVTKNRSGQELAEIGQLVDGGVVALSDGKRPVANAEIMRRALEYTRMFHRRIFSHAQEPDLVADGVMHEGLYSTLLGLKGMPAAAEEIM
ncbi:MAG: dihydroorotase, partial [Planctomycetaceae bacterium]|nr:dihydroorotase [Planctomycetaceae bacterium]